MRLGGLAAGCFLWLAAVVCGQDAQWVENGAQPVVAWRETAGAEWPQPAAAGNFGMGLMGNAGERTVVEVELLEQGRRPSRTAVEVQVKQAREATAWWWLLAAPLLLMIGGGRQRRGLRPAGGVV
jgi:hypothetical protein